jgi:predicted DNA-binding transcriptional regulator AlpA
MTEKEAGSVFQQNDNQAKTSSSDRAWMSVKDMGDLLGIRKTDRYWLVHKNVFETKTIQGKMWVNVESFEKWYANQVKYQKTTGEEPGLELREWSFSPRDIAALLEISEDRVYELIKTKNWETVTVDYWLRIKKDAFWEWYQGQKHYRTSEDRQNDEALENATITFPDAASIIGLTRKEFYPVLRDERYSHFFEIVEIAGRRRITKASFGRFLNGQDRYCIAEKKEPAKSDALPESTALKSKEFKTKEDWLNAKDIPIRLLSIEEAALQAGISPQAISRYAMRGYFGDCRRIGGMVRIPEKQFQAWLTERREGGKTYGFD